jgi:hypothetical protein
VYLHYRHDVRNAATPRALEYLERKRLAGMGITTDIARLGADHVTELLLVDAKFSELQVRK